MGHGVEEVQVTEVLNLRPFIDVHRLHPDPRLVSLITLFVCRGPAYVEAHEESVTSGRERNCAGLVTRRSWSIEWLGFTLRRSDRLTRRVVILSLSLSSDTLVLHSTIMLRIVKSPSLSLMKRSLATHTATGPPTVVAAPSMRHDWSKEEVKRIYDAPLLDLVFRSASVHRQHHDPSKIQLCTLMNIKSK